MRLLKNEKRKASKMKKTYILLSSIIFSKLTFTGVGVELTPDSWDAGLGESKETR